MWLPSYYSDMIYDYLEIYTEFLNQKTGIQTGFIFDFCFNRDELSTKIIVDKNSYLYADLVICTTIVPTTINLRISGNIISLRLRRNPWAGAPLSNTTSTHVLKIHSLMCTRKMMNCVLLLWYLWDYLLLLLLVLPLTMVNSALLISLFWYPQ